MKLHQEDQLQVCDYSNSQIIPLSFDTGGVDYGDFDNTQITFTAGETVVEFNVTIIDDNFIETSETFSGMLSIDTGVSRVVIDSNADTATVIILDQADNIIRVSGKSVL